MSKVKKLKAAADKAKVLAIKPVLTDAVYYNTHVIRWHMNSNNCYADASHKDILDAIKDVGQFFFDGVRQEISARNV